MHFGVFCFACTSRPNNQSTRSVGLLPRVLALGSPPAPAPALALELVPESEQRVFPLPKSARGSRSQSGDSRRQRLHPVCLNVQSQVKPNKTKHIALQRPIDLVRKKNFFLCSSLYTIQRQNRRLRDHSPSQKKRPRHVGHEVECVAIAGGLAKAYS